MLPPMKSILFCFCLVLISSGSACLYENDSDFIMDLTGENFGYEVMDSADVWVVEFYAHGNDRVMDFAPTFVKIAKVMESYVKFGAVDVKVSQDITEMYRVYSVPLFLVFGFNKASPEFYQDVIPTANGLVRLALKALRMMFFEHLSDRLVKSYLVTELTTDTFQKEVLQRGVPWLVYFYKRDSENNEVAVTVMLETAKIVKTHCRVGAVEITSNAGVPYGKEEGVKYFPLGLKNRQTINDVNIPLSTDDLFNACIENNMQVKIGQRILQGTELSVFEAVCNKRDNCIVTFLPQLSVCNKECRLLHLNMVSEFKQKYADEPWGWLWIERDSQVEIEGILHLDEVGYPSIITANIASMTYSPFNGTFTKHRLEQYFMKISYGTGNYQPIMAFAFPNIETVNVWNEADEIEGRPISDEL